MSNLIYSPFLEWVKKEPGRRAIVEGESITKSYGDLFETGCQIASTIRLNATDEIKNIALLGHKTFNSVAAILGTLFSGRAYSPLDINLPAIRYDKIFTNFSPMGLILTGLTPQLRYELKKAKISPSFILDLAGDLPEDAFEGVPRLKLSKKKEFDERQPLGFAYLLFTSGSTGNPKGVCISHNAAHEALRMFQEHISIQENDVIGNQVSLCFDLSMFDIFSSLRQGASLCLIPPMFTSVPSRFVNYLNENSITSIFTVPSVVDYVLGNENSSFNNKSLKKLLLSGEPIALCTIRKIFKVFSHDLEVWNLYGATEIPYALAEKITHEKNLNSFSLKGTNVEVYIKDEVIAPKNREENLVGELLIKSPAMLSGYLLEGNSNLQTPLNYEGWYPTGDLASINKSVIMLYGRADRQVKIKGHRVELDAIEHEIESYPEVKEAAVIFNKDMKKLSAYITLIPNCTEEEIKKRCQSSLSPFMRPDSFHIMEKLPRTASGKKDRQKLIRT
ncbi:MAG: AMP-binding protein [Leptospiraceae bacterium]|nr:AMP-binding protein [Leptospiraceae bacterium]